MRLGSCNAKTIRPDLIQTDPAPLAIPRDRADDLRQQIAEANQQAAFHRQQKQETQRYTRAAQEAANAASWEAAEAYDAIVNGIGAAQAEADLAKRELATATFDSDLIADAQERLT